MEANFIKSQHPAQAYYECEVFNSKDPKNGEEWYLYILPNQEKGRIQTHHWYWLTQNLLIKVLSRIIWTNNALDLTERGSVYTGVFCFNRFKNKSKGRRNYLLDFHDYSVYN